MESGTTAEAAPWRARAAMRMPIWEVSAQITEPIARSANDSRRTRRLPYMSPARPRTGVRTAPERREAVTIQDTAAGEECVRRGRSGRRGITTVCMTAMRMPP